MNNNKPRLSFIHIWNMCFGFLGIQFGFALQNANMSRIFQTLGADISDIAGLWVAAPLTGLLVQPIIGYLSDKTDSRFGRRRPFFFIGAVLTTLALIVMPNSPTLWIAAGTLWVLDASINITMEPFRAFVGDMLPERQRSLGYLMQSFFIGIGAVVASALPWILTQFLSVPNTAPEGEIPDSVRYAFYFGAVVLFVSVMWTVVSTREYTNKELAAFEGKTSFTDTVRDVPLGSKGTLWLIVGAFFSGLIYTQSWDKELYILSIGSAVFGLLLMIARWQQQSDHVQNGFFHIIYDLNTMPRVMKQLAVVQFFSWFALFVMWIYSVPAITSYHFGTTDPQSSAFNDGADWVGVLFGAYNGFAALAAFAIAALANRIGVKLAHFMCLLIGALSFFSFLIMPSPTLLLISMVGIGITWASILSLPYAMLSNAIPQNRMGLYMGIFNFFIVIPQLLAASIMGLVIKYIFSGEAIFSFIVAGCFWLVAAAFTLRVNAK